MVQVGGLATGEGYQDFLTDVLAAREQMSPFSHIRKFDIRTAARPSSWPHTSTNAHRQSSRSPISTWTSMSRPSSCLELLQPHLTKGSVIGFDELQLPRASRRDARRARGVRTRPDPPATYGPRQPRAAVVPGD